ncbi:MAG: hypothetical protein OXU50_07200 [Gammaproteobacteria bacterium]|nr:hypothetical protein [Gammaproteobacteria bacterium]
MTTNTVYTVSIGDCYTKTLWARDSLKAWECYCDRHNLNLHVQTKPVFPFREKSESLLFEKLNCINRDLAGSVLLTDLDNLPVPQAPNIFDLHSDKNITCRVNPFWHFKHPVSALVQDRYETLGALRWPRFRDVKKGRGQWPDSRLYFIVNGHIMLLPPNIRQVFQENYARIVRETPLWDLSFDEGVWAYWIARFSREYNIMVDAFDAGQWAVPAWSPYFGKEEVMPPGCHMVHLYAKKYLSRYYTEWYILNSRKETWFGVVLWRIRGVLGLRKVHLRLFLSRISLFCSRVAARVVRHLTPP